MCYTSHVAGGQECPLNSTLLCWQPLGHSNVERKKVFEMLQDTVDDWQADHVVHGAAALPVRVVAVRTAPCAECLEAVSG